MRLLLTVPTYGAFGPGLYFRLGRGNLLFGFQIGRSFLSIDFLFFSFIVNFLKKEEVAWLNQKEPEPVPF